MHGSGTRLDAVSFRITATAPYRARLARIVGSRVPAPTEVVPNDGFIANLRQDSLAVLGNRLKGS